MKKWFKYSYTILLVITCLIFIPLLEACGEGDGVFIKKTENGTTIDGTTSTDGSTSTGTETETGTQTGTDAPTTNTPSTTVTPTPGTSSGSTTTNSGTAQPLVIPNKDEVINFPDTLFIGDSRTVGLRDWVKIGGATFFCDVGLSSNNVTTKAIKVPNVSDSITLPNLLTQKQFKTVYIMLGINEIGGSLSGIAQKYQNIIKLVQEKQPNAIVVVQSTLYVTKERHTEEVNKNGYFNNNRIAELNTHLYALTNGSTVRWLDMNPMFDDGTGHLAAEAAAGDGIHFKLKYYLIWRKYLDTHRVS